MLTKDDFYFCYSRKVSKHLEEKGIRYLFLFKDINKNNPVSIYEKSEELKKELESYNLNK